MAFDPRFISGAATILIGMFVCAIPLRLWFLHPVRRVLRIGPYITDQGLRALLHSRWLMLGIGLVLLLNGVSRIVFALRWQGLVESDVAIMVGDLEAGLSLWAVWMTLRGAHRIWLKD